MEKGEQNNGLTPGEVEALIKERQAVNVVEAMGADTATQSEINALNDDELFAFWLKASREFDRLAWGSPENFRLRGYLVARRVTWSRAEMDHRQGNQTSRTSPTADE